MNKKNQILEKLLMISVLFQVFLMPSSLDSRMPHLYFTVFQWLLLFIHIILATRIYGSNSKILKLSYTILIYLFLATIVILFDYHFRFSLSRFIPVLMGLIVLSLRKKDNTRDEISSQFKFNIVTIISVIVIIVGILTILKNNCIITILYKYYTQFYEGAVGGALKRGKPVFTFGVHNVASYFYTVLFLLNFKLYSGKKHIMTFIILVIIQILNVKLSSNQSLVYSVFMGVIFIHTIFKQLNKRHYKILLLSLLIYSIVFLIPYNEIFEALLSPVNGVIPRYFSSETIFVENFKIIAKYPLGIGFTIADASVPLYYADSGYVVLLTMGGIPLVLGFYYIFVKFCRENFEGFFSLLYLSALFLFELSMPSLIYYKAIYLHILVFLLFADNKNTSSENKLV